VGAVFVYIFNELKQSRGQHPVIPIKIHDILYDAWNNETVVKKISMLTGGWRG